MLVSSNLPRLFTGVRAAVERHGDDIWEIICATVDPFKPFTVSEVVPAVMADLGLSETTARQYLRAVLHNVRLQFDGHGVVQPRSGDRKWFWNHDNA